MKKLLVFLTILISLSAFGQNRQRHKIVVFTPVYLDSLFDAAGNFRFEKTAFPRFVIPGLEFYQGVQAAADSLEKRNAPLEIVVVDTRGNKSLDALLKSSQVQQAEMFIAQTNAPETRQIAEAALRLKIPFISATFPNDAGMVNNPYFVILNTTLQTHIEKMYEFIRTHHSQDNIIMFRKPGGQEDMIRDQFLNYGKSANGRQLNIKTVNLTPSFRGADLVTHLDSNRRNIIIGGSMDEKFANQLTSQLATVNGIYPVRLFGMPNWDKINYSKLGNLEIIYSSPFFYNRSTQLETKLGDDYNNIYSARPGEMFFRGYETTLRFAMLLLDAKKDVASNLSRKGNTVFTTFDIQPVMKNPASMTLDYFENRNIYFIKHFGGSRYVLND